MPDNEFIAYDLHFNVYGKSFRIHRRDNLPMAKAYVCGLMRCEKNHTNMERMSENDNENDYHRYYHFLSESKCDWSEVNSITAASASAVMQDRKGVASPFVGFIIDEAGSNGVAFDWIGGDGLYGHNSELTRALDSRGLFYVLDVHKNEHVYLEKPLLCVPQKKSARGRPPVRKQAYTKPVSLESYRLGLWHIRS